MGRGAATDLRRPDPGRNHRRRDPGPLRRTDLDGRAGGDQAGSARGCEPARRPAREARRGEGRRPARSPRAGRRIALEVPMPGMPIAVVLILIGAGIGMGIHFSIAAVPCVVVGFVAFLALVVCIMSSERRQREKLHAVAIEEWQREFAERLRIELDRGVTDTMARFMVEPVTERCFPRTYEDAVAYLASRDIIVQDAGGRTVPEM